MDLETLPNYTLVSGLPTYDDALEQLRLNSSTNHLLINHQTLMKLFGSVKEKSDKEKQLRPESPAPSYEDAVRIDRSSHHSNLTDLFFSRNITTIDDGRLDVSTSSSRAPSNSTTSSTISSSTITTTPRLSTHRFICTVVPQLTDETSVLYQVSSEASDTRPALTPTFATSQQPLAVPIPIASTSSSSSLELHRNQLVDIGSSNRSLGSLNIINEIKNSKPDYPWVHRSALSLNFENEFVATPKPITHQHRASLY